MTGFNIQEFSSSIGKNYVLKTNKFLVRFPLPIGLAKSEYRSFLSQTDRYLELWTEATNIPGVLLPTSEIRRYGYGNFERKPYTVTNNEVNFQFLADGQSAVWTFFQQWMKMIVNYDLRAGIRSSTGTLPNEAPFEIAYKEDYVSNVNIIVFDDTGKVAMSIILRDAYPIFIGDIFMNWADNNNIMRIPVTFTMFDWYNENIKVNTGTINMPTKLPDLFESPKKLVITK